MSGVLNMQKLIVGDIVEGIEEVWAWGVEIVEFCLVGKWGKGVG